MSIEEKLPKPYVKYRSTKWDSRKVCHWCGFWPFNRCVKLDVGFKACIGCLNANDIKVEGVNC
jgi:hypothetical protein